MGDVRCYSADIKSEVMTMTPDLLEDLLAFAFVTQSTKRNICPNCGSELEADDTCLVCGEDNKDDE